MPGALSNGAKWGHLIGFYRYSHVTPAMHLEVSQHLDAAMNESRHRTAELPAPDR